MFHSYPNFDKYAIDNIVDTDDFELYKTSNEYYLACSTENWSIIKIYKFYRSNLESNPFK